MNKSKNERKHKKKKNKSEEKGNEIKDDNKAEETKTNDNLNNYPSVSGVIDYTFKRKGYCVNKYDNNDEYFGYYSEDLRNKHGFYSYNPVLLNNNEKLNRYYFGLWKNDLREGNGIYLWSKTKINEKDFNNFNQSNFKVYIGSFLKDKLIRGAFLSKENNNFFVYRGSFSDINKKEGDNCFYYSYNLEQLIYGSFKNDVFIEGYVAKFNKDGNIERFLEFNSGEKREINNSSEFEKIKIIMFNFRYIIMTKDYFSNIYDVFSKVREFKETFLYNIDRLNDDKFEDFVKLCDSFKLATINHDIEEVINI